MVTSIRVDKRCIEFREEVLISLHTALLIRLNKCGKIVHVHEEHTYNQRKRK